MIEFFIGIPTHTQILKQNQNNVIISLKEV